MCSPRRLCLRLTRRELWKAASDLGVDLEVHVPARIAERGVDVVAYLLERVAFPQAKDVGLEEPASGDLTSLGCTRGVVIPRQGSEQIVLGRKDARRGSRRDTELGEDVLHVSGHSSLADHERARDLPVALTARNQT
jgi:hypothetical protein